MAKLRIFCVSALVLALLALSRAALVGAAPPAAPLAGITVTPTALPVLTPTPTPASKDVCDPIIHKQVDRQVARPGDEVVFTISVVNVGHEAAVEARVLDRVPDTLEIVEVKVIPEDQGQEVLPRKGQTVHVDLGTLGQDFQATVVIRTRVRADAPAQVCIENVAEFRAPNCPDRSAEVACWQLPESGGRKVPWIPAALLVTGALALGLIVAIAALTRFSI